MGRPKLRTHNVASGNHKRFFGVWEVGAPYINVYASGRMGRAVVAYEKGEVYSEAAAIHVIGTSGDLKQDGTPKDGRTPDQYVKDEVKAFAEESGDDYLAAMSDGYPG